MKKLIKRKKIADLTKIAKQIYYLEINQDLGEEEKIEKISQIIGKLNPKELMYIDKIIMKNFLQK